MIIRDGNGASNRREEANGGNESDDTQSSLLTLTGWYGEHFLALQEELHASLNEEKQSCTGNRKRPEGKLPKHPESP